MERILKASLITAIKTPYHPDGSIDYDSFDKLVERQKLGGVDGLVVGGTTGEGHLMDWDEHVLLIAHCVNKFGSDMVIVGNTGSNNTREAKKATAQGFAVGMDAALQINPYYGKTSMPGLKAHFAALLEIGPAIVYNVPGRTGQDLPPELVEELAQHPNFVGMKECAGTDRIREYEAKGIPCWSGNDDEAHDSRHDAKSHGVISVTSHLLPQTMRSLMDEKNDELNQKIQPLIGWLFAEPNPIPLNTALCMSGVIQPVFRLPYLPVDHEARAELVALVEELELQEEVGKLHVMRDTDFTIV